MHSRTIDVVTGWETVATPAGYEGLRRLADRGFSGAVSAGPAWAFFLNGRVVGVFEGGIEDFEDADATAYRAADPSLPILFAMQERGGETRANYYTNETPLRDVDQTLESGGFTGYIELSENVLSGDYYVVYHGGKSMSAAFVGSSERLVTGEEAFETAADEVGIYEVVDVDIELVEIPEPEPEPESTADEGADDDADGRDVGAGAAAVAADADADTGEGETADPSGPTDAEGRGDPLADDGPPNAPGADPAPPTGSDADAASGSGPEPGSKPVGSATAPDTDQTEDPDTPGSAAGDRDAADDPEQEADPDPTPDPGQEGAAGAGATEEAGPEPGGDATPDPDDPGGPSDRGAPADAAATEDGTAQPAPAGADPDRGPSGGDGAAGAASTPDAGTDAEGDGALTDEKRWQQARTIPSLDPDASAEGSDGDAEREDPDAARERTAQMQRQRRRRRAARDRTGPDAGRGATASSAADPGGDRGELDRLRERLSTAKERIESLEAERDALRAEREDIAEERDALRDERAERTDRVEALEAECDRLRGEIDRLRSRLDDDGSGSGSDPSGASMPPDRALSGTNLFVRYGSKGQATLKHAHAGEASQSDVRENLRLEHHTTFEAEGVTVEDRPYEEFLRDSTEYAFARWVVLNLLYEIGETGNRSELAGVFDAIPDIDRVELHGTVGVETDDGVEQRSFDVVFRDRMGDPLFVADINPSRDATTEAMVGSLVENAHTVATEAETLAAGLYVTESFYEPGALETVADRTGGGLLSRSKKRSFVKLSRKRGYHLCLVEARDGEFHLNVPEL